MKAIVYSEYGPPSVLRLAEVEPPVLSERDVLVRVHAASINSWDRDNLRGAFANRGMLGWRRPRVAAALGGDIAGRVEAVGPGVTRFSPGDEVFGDLSASGWGAFAELARAPEDALTRKPLGLSFEQAAAMPQAAVMALQGIRDHGDVQAGQRVLVNGAGGGVGSFAVQLAKLRGAEVTAVDASSKLEMLRGLGVDHVIDYRAQDYTRGERRYDFVLDCELHRSVFDCLRVLAPGGKLTVVGGSIPRLLQLVTLGKLRQRLGGPQVALLMHRANADLGYLGELAARGELRPVIEREYSLDQVPLAMQRLCDGLIVGKAVIKIVTRNARGAA